MLYFDIIEVLYYIACRNGVSFELSNIFGDTNYIIRTLNWRMCLPIMSEVYYILDRKARTSDERLKLARLYLMLVDGYGWANCVKEIGMCCMFCDV